jgi:predicted TIM-barrel fold metal-dependent hydrolase
VSDRDNVVIVSCDGHVAAPVHVYARHLEERYHPLLWELYRESEEYVELFGGFGRPTADELAVFDTRGALASGAELGAWDVERRLAELDAEGIAAELLLATTQFATMPFFAAVNHVRAAEVRFAGARAWNRLICEMATDAPGRLYGVVEPGPCHDIRATVDELIWCAEHGCVSVTVPGSPADAQLPPLHDPHFDPFWTACDELGLVLSVHAGWGLEQEHLHRVLQHDSLEGANLMDIQKKLARLDLGPRSVFWKLMVGGVFDRHPGLRLALTEIRADWLPATLAFLDERLTPANSPISMSPTEYFRRHCVVVPSSIHRAEVEMRHDIGIDALLFGADFPHFEGTWPNTWDWIRDALSEVPENEARAILGENAVRTFGLDVRRVTAVARRIGPSPEQLFTGAPVEPRLIDHFDQRSAYLRPAEVVDLAELAAWVDRDLTAVTSA